VVNGPSREDAAWTRKWGKHDGADFHGLFVAAAKSVVGCTGRAEISSPQPSLLVSVNLLQVSMEKGVELTLCEVSPCVRRVSLAHLTLPDTFASVSINPCSNGS
jgi:hypothetical protein